jgi:hypothetical protein
VRSIRLLIDADDVLDLTVEIDVSDVLALVLLHTERVVIGSEGGDATDALTDGPLQRLSSPRGGARSSRPGRSAPRRHRGRSCEPRAGRGDAPRACTILEPLRVAREQRPGQLADIAAVAAQPVLHPRAERGGVHFPYLPVRDRQAIRQSLVERPRFGV